MSTIIITGAGSGIGRAAAHIFAGLGWNLVLCGQTRQKLEETQRGLRDAAGKKPAGGVLVAEGDLTDEPTCRRVVAGGIKEFADIDALANVAGVVRQQSIAQITPGMWAEVVAGNLSSAVFMTAAVWPHFRGRKRGVIVNISSMASVDPFPGLGLYATAKAGLNMFTLVTGREGEPLGIRAACIAPGAVETPMLRSLYSHQDVPPQNALAPQTIAQAIADCVTGQRRFKNGETIQMDSP